jgi:hypothetical protein
MLTYASMFVIDIRDMPRYSVRFDKGSYDHVLRRYHRPPGRTRGRYLLAVIARAVIAA